MKDECIESKHTIAPHPLLHGLSQKILCKIKLLCHMAYILLLIIAQISRLRVTLNVCLMTKGKLKMDFTIPEDLRMIQATIRRFVEKDLEPISRQVEEELKQ